MTLRNYLASAAHSSYVRQGARQRRGQVLCNRRVDGPYTHLPNWLIQGVRPDAGSVPGTHLHRVPSARLEAAIREGFKVCRIGRDACYKALNEHEGRALARHIVVRDAASGRIRHRRWEFTLTPDSGRSKTPGYYQ
jgi:hypothetical protein